MRAIQPPHIKYVISGGLAVVLGLALLLAFVVFQGAAQATTFTVNNTGDSGAGSLRQAIADAASGDTIDFSVTGTILLTSGPLSVSNKTINGPGPAALSIDGNATSRVFNLSGGAIISGLTIKNGNDSSAAGGISAGGGLMTITNSTISGNSAFFGAALKIQSGTLTITDSTISGNLNGGGASDIEVSGTATMNLINSTISGNTRAGVQAAHDATVTLINSTVSRNGGGGVRADHDSTVTLINSTVSENSSFGILHASSVPVKIKNTISALNIGNDCQGTPTSQGHNLDSDGTCGLAATGDLSNTDPLLDPLGLRDNGGPTRTIALLPGSPAIDTGDDSVLGPPHNLTTDQRGAGFPRLQGAHVDIGAFEAPPPDTPQTSPITVTKTGDTNDGLCGVSDCSLREAIASGDSGDAINIPLGVYTLSLGTELTIDQNLTLTGAGSGDTIIQAAASSADATSRVFNITGGTVAVSGVTVQNGNNGDGGGILNSGTLNLTNSTVSNNTANVGGGGIFNVGGNLTLTDSTVSGNTASLLRGGGIHNFDGTLTLTNSTVTGNTSKNSGGGIYNSFNNGTLTLTNSTVSGNTANSGGGIMNDSATLNLTNSTVSGNTTPNHGGGIYSSGTMTLTNSTVSGNTAGLNGGGLRGSGTTILTNSTVSGNTASLDGGGLWGSGTTTLINSTVSGNTTGSDGGGIYNNNSLMTITNSTVTGNTAGDDGGGMFNSADILLVNTIIAGNSATATGPDCSGVRSPNSLGHNLVGDDTGCGFTTAIGDLVNVDPLLGTLANNGGPTLTHALLSGSPAIDSGDGSVLGSPLFLTTDQRGVGFPRLQGAHVDIGAFEAAPPPNTPPVADPQNVNTTQDTPVLITLTGSDSDIGNSLSFKVTRLPNSGDLSDGSPVAAPRAIAGDTLTYSPNAGINGADSFEFIANDGTADSAAATVTVNINLPPPGAAPLPRMPSLQQQFDILADPNAPPELAHSAIEQLPGMLLGPPVVLPTSGGQVSMETWMESIRFFDRASVDLEDAINALTSVKMDNATDAGLRAHANQVGVLLEATLSVVRGLAHQVGGVDPAGTLPPHLRSDRQKIDGPFLPLAPVGFGQFPIERTEVCNIESGESSGGGTDAGGSFSEFSSHGSACIITKESFGVKAVLFHRVISVYQEPWDVRVSPIIGHEVVWYIRWIPAEHIKTIIYERDATGRVKMRIRQNDILMPGLSKFWSFYPQ